MKRTLLTVLALLPLASPAVAEDEFLTSFGGQWTGTGKVRINTASPAVGVDCSFAVESDGESLSMDGRCRGMVVVTRKVGLQLRAGADGFTGTYIGSRGGPAGLSGKRADNALDLVIAWARAVNGDRQARLVVEKIDDDTMRMVTYDMDYRTGRTVTTSSIEVHRTGEMVGQGG